MCGIKNKFEEISNLLFYFSILIFLLAFNFSDNPIGNWYQQFMPNIGGRSITDITFLDSLNGYAVTNNFSPSDTGYILKTTNGGDNWVIVTILNRTFTRIKFINNNTGFVCGGTGGGTPYIYKTTNAGASWFILSTFGCALWRDMAVLNNDTIWIVDSDGLCGGVFRTTNGGASWQNQGSYGSYNPDRIYMFNARIGFHTKNLGSSSRIYKTTDSGATWTIIVSNDYFKEIHFADSLTGWKSSAFGMKKTTDGGLNWVVQPMPTGGYIQNSFIYDFALINRDTLWGTGGYVQYPNNQTRGILYRTTNGGINWLYQIPDTSINISYSYMRFTDKLHGWVYDASQRGIHTTTGGDTQFYVSVKQISSEIPKQYQLFQNYPNPFNSKTIINYQLSMNGHVKLKIYDMLGKEIVILVDKKENAGTYQVDWDAGNYPSGVYFYSLFVDGVLIDTKKMILVK